MKPVFFQTPSSFREWLEEHHAKAEVLLVGFYKKGSAKPSITWPESVDQALCYGWIDGVRKSIDKFSYTIRFTPRKRGSIWSSVNIKRAQALIEQGQMQPAGLKAYQARKENKSGSYSYEQRSVDLEEPYNQLLKKNEAAWSFFQKQPASYRKAISWWIISAKKDETRLKRLERLMAYSVQGQRLPEFTARKPAQLSGWLLLVTPCRQLVGSTRPTSWQPGATNRCQPLQRQKAPARRWAYPKSGRLLLCSPQTKTPPLNVAARLK
jgi:uncharacterized protein YdeI (YjbR/CyaY-like superfamily)